MNLIKGQPQLLNIIKKTFFFNNTALFQFPVPLNGSPRRNSKVLDVSNLNLVISDNKEVVSN